MKVIPEQLITRRKLSEEVTSRIEGMIRDGAFAPGDQLPSERDLMKLFGVGRPAIREGLFSLQKMGLLVIGSGARARVTRPTPAAVVKSLSGAARYFLAEANGITHFQQVRAFFEVGLAREAALRATAADIRALREALEANHEAIPNIATFEKTDVAFHYVLAEIPRNPIFVAIHEAFVEWLTEQRHIALKIPRAHHVAYRAHKGIFEAIAKHDPDAAEKAMRSHLAHVSRCYWKARDTAAE